MTDQERAWSADDKRAWAWLSEFVEPAQIIRRDVESLAAEFEAVRAEERERNAQIAEYSINDEKLRKKVAERIRCGMIQHVNVAAIRESGRQAGEEK